MPFRIRVLFFGVLRDLLGRSSDTVTVTEGATLADIVQRYSREVPRLQQLAPTLAFSVNQEYATTAAALHEGDEVAMLPPVSGGSTSTAAGIGPANCVLTRCPLCAVEIRERLQQPEDGAVIIFEGVVRNHSRNRRTVFLEYESYEAMALGQMQKLIVEARQRFPIREAAIHHRLGRLEIGEPSVVIVVGSAHRAAAFDACRWLIDTLKRTVPIWKKEHFEDGAIWADGEPFPASIVSGE